MIVVVVVVVIVVVIVVIVVVVVVIVVVIVVILREQASGYALGYDLDMLWVCFLASIQLYRLGEGQYKA